MRRAKAVDRRARKTTFTLVELLTVMVIVAVLMAVAIPTMLKITSGSSVEAASRMIGAQLRLARQEAITKRKYVAVLFPKTSGAGIPTKAFYQGFRSCYVDGGTMAWEEWVPNTSWNYVPIGAIIAEVDDDNSINDPILDNSTTTVVDVEGNTGVNARAVVFRPSGRLVLTGGGLRRCVTLVEGAATPGAAPGIIPKNRDNWIDLRVNQYTGRVTYGRPED